METFRQIAAISAWNFRTIWNRARSAFIVVLGFFGVVLVFAAVFSIREGLIRGLHAPDTDSVAFIYTRIGTLNDAALKLVTQAPQIRHSTQGALAFGSMTAFLYVPEATTGLRVTVTLRGVGENIQQVLPHFRLLKGRTFRAGMNEIIVGETAERLSHAFGIGRTLRWNRRTWTVVGIFATDSNIRDSSAMTDVHQLQSVDGSGDRYTSFFVRLMSADAFPAFKSTLSSDPRLSLVVDRLSDFDQQFAGSLGNVLTVSDSVITLFMALGAVFAALNIMYANVASRRGEIATLRLLGFGRTAILVAVSSEALALALIGGGLGVLAAYLTFNGYQARTLLGGASTGFTFAITPTAIGLATLLSVAMGLIGGLFPAVRAAHLPLAAGLRDA